MHVINVMFSKGVGGIEQALVDYCEALKLKNHKVTAIIAPKAKIKPSLLKLGINIIEVKNFAAWDFFAKQYLKKIIKQLAPDAIIVHGNRAVSLTKQPAQNIPVIGVTHNYSIKRLIGLDAIFAITEDLKQKVIDAGQDSDKIFKLPNMVRVNKKKCKASKRSIITIGTMGRFVHKKGFDVFIQALSELKNQEIEFSAVIGGSGDEEENLKNLASKLGLTSKLEFIGWVEDKEKFFSSIDIFVLPSRHEPFGIILLEAFACTKPVITSDSEGPREIATHEKDALIVKKDDIGELVNALKLLIQDKKLAKKLSQNGFAQVLNYDIKNFASILESALLKVTRI